LTRHQRSAFEPLARGQSPPWRVKGNGSDEVTLQVYPHARYIDEVVGLRVKDQGRLYAHQDANWNVTALTDLTGRVIEQYWYSPYGQLEAHVAAHPFDFDDDGDVDAQDIAAGTSGGTCWGDYDGASGDCKRLDADGDRDIDVDDYTIVNNYVTAQATAKPPLQRIPARPATAGAETSMFAHQGSCRLMPNWLSIPEPHCARQYAPAARRFMHAELGRKLGQPGADCSAACEGAMGGKTRGALPEGPGTIRKFGPHHPTDPGPHWNAAPCPTETDGQPGWPDVDVGDPRLP
jgi:hypothetical protein